MPPTSCEITLGRFAALLFPLTALVLLAVVILFRGHSAAPLFGRHAIEFYPGQYARIVFNSGEDVSAAMKVVHAASNPTELNAAIAAVQKLVDAGDAEAAFRLGRFYHLESAEPNYALALQYYQTAVAENHAWAMNNLGLLYRSGLGVNRDASQAYVHFEQAYRHKNPWAYNNLSQMTGSIKWLAEGAANDCTLCLIQEAAAYHSGVYGVRRDTDKTVELLRKASALGDSQATLIMAELYLVGDGLPQSSLKAFDTLKRLSEQGDADATNRLGELVADNQILHYTFDHFLGGARQIPDDFSKAFPQNPAEAIHYWELANQQGSCQSFVNLSSVYDRGVGVITDHQRAADYVEQSVRCDPSDSFYLWKQAMRFFDANGRAHDCEAAEKYFVQSLAHGYADAAVDLGYIFDKGCGTIARNDTRAFQIYLLGAKLGVALCQNNVGAMIKHGRGVQSADPARGYGWIKLAALNGDELANKNLQDPLFNPEVRAVGLAHLADIQARLILNSADPQVIMSDPWY
jgi:TPR repeat protein